MALDNDNDRDIRIGLEVDVTDNGAAAKLARAFQQIEAQERQFTQTLNTEFSRRMEAEIRAYNQMAQAEEESAGRRLTIQQRVMEAQRTLDRAGYTSRLQDLRNFLAERDRLEAQLQLRASSFGQTFALTNRNVLSLGDITAQMQGTQQSFDAMARMSEVFSRERQRLEAETQSALTQLVDAGTISRISAYNRELEAFRAHMSSMVAAARAAYAEMSLMRSRLLPPISSPAALERGIVPLAAQSSFPIYQTLPASSYGTPIPQLGTGNAYIPAVRGGAGQIQYNVAQQIPGTGGPQFNYGAFANAFWQGFQQFQQRYSGGGFGALPPGGGGGGFGGGFSSSGPNFSWSNFIQGANLGQNSLNGLTSTITTLQMLTTRLAFTGFRVLSAEILGTIGVLYKVSEQFLQINERFAVFQIMLTSILKSATQAQDIRSEITRITATSPIPFEGIAELVKSLAIIPGTRQGLINQAQSGQIQDPEGFLQRSIQMVEQMLTFRPDKKVEDAIFSIREALGGEFRSLVRRFDIPLAAVSAYSGVAVGELKADPAKTLKALQALFDQLVDPAAVREASRQPSKLFQNILEQIFVNPILALGSDSKIRQTGESLYNSILTPFQKLLSTATQFSTRPTDSSGNPIAGSESPLQHYAQQAAEPIFSMFTKASTFLAKSVEDALDRMGVKTGDRNMPIMERLAQAGVEILNQWDQNFIPFLERTKKVLFNLIELLQNLAKAVAGFLNTFGETVTNHPVMSLLALSSARGFVTSGIRMTAGAVGASADYAAMSRAGMTASQFASAGGAIGTQTVGTYVAGGLAGLAATVSSVLIVGSVVAAAVILYEQLKARTAGIEARATYAKRAGEDVSIDAISPGDRAKVLQDYMTQEERLYQAEDNRRLHPRTGIAEAERQREVTKQIEDSLRKQFGYTDDMQIFGQQNIKNAQALTAELQKQQGLYESSGQQLKRNVNFIQDMVDKGRTNVPNMFGASLASEKDFPMMHQVRAGQVTFDQFKGLASPDVEKVLTQVEKEVDPLKALTAYGNTLEQALKQVQTTQEHINSFFSDPTNTAQFQKEADKSLETVDAQIADMKAHPAFGEKFIDPVTNTLRTYEEILASLGEFRQTLATNLENGMPAVAAQQHIRQLKESADALQTGLDKDFDRLMAGALELSKFFTNFKGTEESAANKIQDFAQRFGLQRFLTPEQIQAFSDSVLKEGVPQLGMKGGDKNKAAEALQSAFEDLVNELASGLQEYKKAAVSGFQHNIDSEVERLSRAGIGSGLIDPTLKVSPLPDSSAATREIIGGRAQTADNRLGAVRDPYDQVVSRAMASLQTLLSHVDAPERSNYEGQVAAQQFAEDIALMSKKYPELGQTINNLNFDITDLYTNTKKLGQAGLEEQVVKLREAANLTEVLAKNLHDLAYQAKGGIESPEGKRLLDESRRLQMSAAQERTRADLIYGDPNPFSSFTSGFAQQSKLAHASFTDLSEVGKGTADAIGNAFNQMWAQIEEGGHSATDVVKGFFRVMLQGIAQVLAQQATKELVAGIGSVLGAAAGAYGSSGSSSYLTQAALAEGHARGGPITGGSGMRDDVLVPAMSGEWVVTQKGVKALNEKFGPRFLTDANEGRIQHFIIGGKVGNPDLPPIEGGYNRGSIEVDSGLYNGVRQPSTFSDLPRQYDPPSITVTGGGNRSFNPRIGSFNNPTAGNAMVPRTLTPTPTPNVGGSSILNFGGSLSFGSNLNFVNRTYTSGPSSNLHTNMYAGDTPFYSDVYGSYGVFDSGTGQFIPTTSGNASASGGATLGSASADTGFTGAFGNTGVTGTSGTRGNRTTGGGFGVPNTGPLTNYGPAYVHDINTTQGFNATYGMALSMINAPGQSNNMRGTDDAGHDRFGPGEFKRMMDAEGNLIATTERVGTGFHPGPSMAAEAARLGHPTGLLNYPHKATGGGVGSTNILGMGGEFLLNAEARATLGDDFLGRANQGIVDIPHMAGGGGVNVSRPDMPAVGNSYASTDNYQINIPVTMASGPGEKKKNRAEAEAEQRRIADALRAAVTEELQNQRRIGGMFR